METKQLDIILKYCHNYDDIVNFTYDCEDLITKKIINYYKDYILDYSEKSENQNLIELVDIAVNEYIKNPKFYKFFQNNFNDTINNELVYVIINLYQQFKEDEIKDIESTKWI